MFTFEEMEGTILNDRFPYEMLSIDGRILRDALSGVMQEKGLTTLMAAYEYIEDHFGGSLALGLLQYYMEK